MPRSAVNSHGRRVVAARATALVLALLSGLGISPGATVLATSRSAAPPHPAQAPSPIAGHWEAEVQGDGRVFTFVFDFTTRGDSLGGVLSIAEREGETRIAGSVKGSRIHFEQFGFWDGVLSGANLKLTRGLDGGKVQHLVAHRVTAK